MMQSNHEFTAEELAANDPFIQWVLTPDAASNETWQAWAAASPERQDTLQKAQQLVLLLRKMESVPIPKTWMDETWQAIEQDTRHEARIRKLVPWRRVAVAATVAGLMALAGFWALKNKNFGSDATAAQNEKQEWRTAHNRQTSPQTILLPDSSIVLLEPGSALEYPSFFNGEDREVTLSGDAFFYVQKDSAHPFIVLAQGTVTRVLGTSFRVKTAGKNEVEVSVKTGKVAVYSAPETGEAAPVEIPKDAVLLTPNQRVVFNPVKLERKKLLVENPVMLLPAEALPKFHFEEAPAAEIFGALSDAYGVEIAFRESDVRNCRLTTTLTDLPLFEKLEIICSALGVSYSKQDTTIVIIGNGCE